MEGDMSARREGVLIEDCEPRLVQVSLVLVGRDIEGERVGYGILESNLNQIPCLKTTMDSPTREPGQLRARRRHTKA